MCSELVSELNPSPASNQLGPSQPSAGKKTCPFLGRGQTSRETGRLCLHKICMKVLEKKRVVRYKLFSPWNFVAIGGFVFAINFRALVNFSVLVLVSTLSCRSAQTTSPQCPHTHRQMFLKTAELTERAELWRHKTPAASFPAIF